ncbi:hypothetical protein [Collimonas pratensis]|uniref:Putative oxidoreductase domain protein n=1 Tax=Collimonas pratensis TaxID=279113 RepID=A0A127Q4X7_9BURK|nr:hypothetical protein [Collimonas pratensis]AMP05071.1 putative oxidoreductase domain protein [Collimonas pratensis]
MEYAKDGIRVIVVAPGTVDTPCTKTIPRISSSHCRPWARFKW